MSNDGPVSVFDRVQNAARSGRAASAPVAPALPVSALDRTASTRSAPAAKVNFGTVTPEQVRTSRFFSRSTIAGTMVNYLTAQRHSAVFRCVNYYKGAIGQIPWRAMRRLDNGGAEPIKGSLDRVLYSRPCPEHSPAQFKGILTEWALLHGNGYAEIQRNRMDEIVGMWPFHPLRTRLERNSQNELRYKVQTPHGEVELKPEQVFHLRGFGDDVAGKGIIEHAAQTIGWAQAAETFGASFFKNNLTLGGIIIQKGEELSEEARDILLEEYEARHAGADKAHRPLILDAGMEWKQTTATPEQGQFLETVKHADRLISRFFGLPPTILGITEQATLNNFEQMSIQVIVEAVVPLARNFEEEADYKLAPEEEIFTRMFVDKLLRGDMKTLSEVLVAYVNNGILTRNEARAEIDHNPKTGADELTAQAQYLPVGSAPPPKSVKESPNGESESALRALTFVERKAS